MRHLARGREKSLPETRCVSIFPWALPTSTPQAGKLRGEKREKLKKSVRHLVEKLKKGVRHLLISGAFDVEDGRACVGLAADEVLDVDLEAVLARVEPSQRQGLDQDDPLA